MKIVFNFDELLSGVAIRNVSGLWALSVHDHEGENISHHLLNDVELGAAMSQAISGGFDNGGPVDTAIYNLIPDAIKDSGLVP